MDNIENLENAYNIEDTENIELYELIAKAVNFLTDNKNETGERYLSIAITEEIIPKTQNNIKKFVLVSYKDLVKQNNSIRIMNNPLYRLINSNFDYNLTEPLLEYFEDEKKCLLTLKNFLNSKTKLPKASFVGVLTSTIIHIHNVNTDKINAIIDMENKLQNSPYNLTLPSSYTTPDNHEFVNNIEKTVSKYLVKK